MAAIQALTRDINLGTHLHPMSDDVLLLLGTHRPSDPLFGRNTGRRGGPGSRFERFLAAAKRTAGQMADGLERICSSYQRSGWCPQPARVV